MQIFTVLVIDRRLEINQRRRRATLVVSMACMACMGAAHLPGFAQPSVQGGALTPPMPHPVVATNNSLDWTQLSAAQKQALQPLETSWNTLTEGRRRKWLAIAQNFGDLDPQAQQKLQARMTQWASLNPRDRELARLNFAESKKIASGDRTTNWETYQALSPDEKQKLAEKAPPKSMGAAVAIKPVSKQKLAEVPVTRRTPEGAPSVAKSKQSIDRNTLLPQSANAADIGGVDAKN